MAQSNAVVGFIEYLKMVLFSFYLKWLFLWWFSFSIWNT